MSEQAEQVIVVRDGAGAYYAIPLAAVAMYRVPEEHWDELAARFDDESDVRGYFLTLPLAAILFSPSSPASGTQAPRNPHGAGKARFNDL